MITKDEIESKSVEFEIHVANVERDYVFGWFLAGLYTISPLKDSLILKGGNCFRKAYFPATRFSADLDFSTQAAVDQAGLRAELNKICDFVHEAAGIVFDTERTFTEQKFAIDNEKTVYHARLYFKDFYGNPEKITISIRLDITEFDRLYLPVQSRNLVHPYSDAQQCVAQIRCVKLEELLATKLKCLLQRRHLADLFDYVYSIFINRELAVDKGEIVSTFLRKTIFSRDRRAITGLFVGLPLHAFKEVWSKYITCPRISMISWDAAVENFVASIKELFGEAVAPFGRSIYFPAHLRNPIMDAGSSLTLLAVTYEDVKRVVEPYSLTYKQRKDGHAEEYFYCYDRTGGSSGPGTKCFVNWKIAAIENLPEKFEPRREVELSKAGEYGDKIYFERTGGIRAAATRASSPRRYRSPRLVYKIACSYCGKVFTRLRHTTRLNAHKDRFGNACFGRYGHLIGQDYR
jgi:predicted nucleotidyltransferase component of viral defense system